MKREAREGQTVKEQEGGVRGRIEGEYKGNEKGKGMGNEGRNNEGGG